MDRDYLERFILENRDHFEDAAPSTDVWAGIDEALGRREAKRVTMWRNLRAAAAAIALLVVGAGAGSYLTYIQQPAAVVALEEVAPEYGEMERYYQTQINERYQQLVSYEKEGLVKADLQQLDEVMKELRAELTVAPKGKEEQIVENLIISYQTKIEILERVLARMQAPAQKAAENEISI